MSLFPRIVFLAAALASACTPLTRSAEDPLSPEEIRMRAIEGKLADLGRRMNGVENKEETKLQDDLRNLRGEIERLRFDYDSQQRRSKDWSADIERRLQRLEGPAGTGAPVAAMPPVAESSPAASAAVPPPVVYPPAAAPPAAPAAPAINAEAAAQEQAAYLKAFDFLKSGKYDNAITSFRSMLDQWPQGNFADNGWYWLGESQYVKRQYKPALESYTTLLERFPASPKVPDAIFKTGLAQLELKQVDQAKASWRRVVKDYPNSNAAGLARQRLMQTP